MELVRKASMNSNILSYHLNVRGGGKCGSTRSWFPNIGDTKKKVWYLMEDFWMSLRVATYRSLVSEALVGWADDMQMGNTDVLSVWKSF